MASKRSGAGGSGGLSTFRIGEAPPGGPALRLGTVRHLPRGVKAEERDALFDAWLPLLAPSAELFQWIRQEPIDDKRWARFVDRYRAEMTGKAEPREAIKLLALLSHRTPIAVGCYCADENRCHRSVLHALIREAGAA